MSMLKILLPIKSHWFHQTPKGINCQASEILVLDQAFRQMVQKSFLQVKDQLAEHS
ncbi:hypothetical protein BL107_09471 [Synechococcus sp. BL107]|nr:hypothetical protein BL107_09471 [Synechococcus sp. BL107]